MAHRRGNKEPQTPWCRNAGTQERRNAGTQERRNAGTQERRKEAVAVPGNAGTQAVMSNEDKPGGSLVWNWPHRESGNRERGGRGSVAGGAGGGGARGDNRGGAIMQAEAFLLSCGLPDGSSKTRFRRKRSVGLHVNGLRSEPRRYSFEVERPFWDNAVKVLLEVFGSHRAHHGGG